MPYYRLKHNFTAGELSPLMHTRVDFERYQNGCKIMENAFCATQGPAIRRPGFKFIYDLNRLNIDVDDPTLRTIPFIFNEVQAYTLVFFKDDTGVPWLVFGTTNAKGEDGLLTYPNPPPTECPPGTVITPAPAAGDVVAIQLPDDWDIENFDWAQSADNMYIAQSGLKPHIIKREGEYCWTVSEVTFTGQPSEWSDQNGWPERVTFHQQRLVFAANTLFRQTVWMTRAGDFSSFETNTGPSGAILSSDAVTFTLDSGTQNKIKWITSGKSLHIGTLGNEWTVDGDGQTALTPENILARRQTNNGGEDNKPLLVGLTTLFIERHGRVVNEFVYDFTYDSYKTSDLVILSPHITEHFSIIDWTYQQTPDSIIWCIREDGVIAGITYQRHHSVVGWHRHTTDGKFKTITCIPGTTREDDVWVTVERVIDGNKHIFLEKLSDWFKQTDAEYGRFLDSYQVYYPDKKKFESFAVNNRDITITHTAHGLDTDDYIRLFGLTATVANPPAGPGETHIDGLNRTLKNQVFKIVAADANTFTIRLPAILPQAKIAQYGYNYASENNEYRVGTKKLIGLDYLEGKKVGILADGTVHPPLTVTNGRIDLNNGYTHIVVGLPYVTEIRPNVADIASTTVGSAEGRMKRITHLYIDFYRSLGAYVGRFDQEDGEQEEEIPFRVPGDLMGLAVPLYTGWYKYSFLEGFDSEAEYFIRQKQPLPLIVRGVIDEVEVQE